MKCLLLKKIHEVLVGFFFLVFSVEKYFFYFFSQEVVHLCRHRHVKRTNPSFSDFDNFYEGQYGPLTMSDFSLG